MNDIRDNYDATWSSPLPRFDAETPHPLAAGHWIAHVFDRHHNGKSVAAAFGDSQAECYERASKIAATFNPKSQ